MLIGFCGLPRSGKSTAARYLVERYRFRHLNVGDPIHDMLRGFYRSCGLSEYGITHRMRGDLKEAPDPLLNGKTPRYAMQTLGKEWRDLISPSLFADRWGDKIDLGGDVVADGMRYADELEVLRGRGGLLVRVERPGVRNQWDHPAERQLLVADETIHNDGTLPELQFKIERLVDRLRKKP